MHSKNSVDRVFLIIVVLLIISGFLVFISASLGTLASNQPKFYNLLESQIGFGLILGSIAMYAFSRLKYQFWRKYAFWIFLFSIALSILVFIPGVGMEHGGAKRWIDLKFITIQPGEILKFGVVIYLAAWFTFIKKRIHSPYFGILPLVVMLGIAGGLLVAQPDTGTFLIAVAGGIAMYIAAGGRWRDIFLLFLMGVMLLAGLAWKRPYVRERITTLFHHSDFQDSGYQVKQSLIAVGSGGIFGKGFGQSIQKFNYLPEAQGDSIFAVLSEEFGLVGSSTIVALYLLFALRGLWIAGRAPDKFGGLVATGLVILITSQSFLNIGSMLAVAPLTGVPLVFISQGGTALLLGMAEVGILLNISRYRRV